MNVEHRIMYPTIEYGSRWRAGASSTFEVRRWTFDVRYSNYCVWNYE